MYGNVWGIFKSTYLGWVSRSAPHVGPGCVFCPRIDPLPFLAGCRRRRLNQGLVVALGFCFSLLDMACFCVIFFGLWVHALFSLLSFCYQYQCNWLPVKIRPRNDLYVLSGTLNLAQLKLKLKVTVRPNALFLELIHKTVCCLNYMHRSV